MTLRKFERLVRQTGLQVISRRHYCVKGLDFLGRIPGVREFAVNQVACLLTKAAIPYR